MLRTFYYNGDEFDGDKIRMMMIGGEPWFLSQDICKVLEIKPSMINEIRDHEKSYLVLQNSIECRTISSTGVYYLIAVSNCLEHTDSDSISDFLLWFSQELMPSIRLENVVQQEEQKRQLSSFQDLSSKELSLSISKDVAAIRTLISNLDFGMDWGK